MEQLILSIGEDLSHLPIIIMTFFGFIIFVILFSVIAGKISDISKDEKKKESFSSWILILLFPLFFLLLYWILS